MFSLKSSFYLRSAQVLLAAGLWASFASAQDAPSAGDGSGQSLGGSAADTSQTMGTGQTTTAPGTVPVTIPNGAQGLPRGTVSNGIVLPGRRSAAVPKNPNGEAETPVSQLVAAPPLTDFQLLVRRSTQKLLPIFGQSLFEGVPSTFAPVQNVPVTPDYVVGPGDELLVQAWGQVTLDGHYAVDRTGNIYIPQVGPVHVAGLPYAKINDYIRSQMSRVFKNFDLNVNMGQLRSIQIFVVGQAYRPGSFTISSLSTLVNALFATGGPTPNGSLRDIQVLRNGEAVVHFDMYDLLLKGDKSKDVQLLPGDVVYIPPAGRMIALVGSVNNPAIYELKSETTLQDAVGLAGGLTNTASSQQVRIERIIGHRDLSVLDVKLDPTGYATQLQDGDVIELSAIVDRFTNAVTLRGNVTNPGRYPWHAGMRIRDLIPNEQALVTRRYWERHNQLGNPGFGPSSFEGEGALSAGGSDAPERGPNGSATAQGGARSSLAAATTANSGVFLPRNDVIVSGPDINWDYAVIERQLPKSLSTTLIPFNLGGAVRDDDEKDNLELMAGDVVTIFSKADLRVPQSQQTRFVRLEGEFLASGVYTALPGETLRQLVIRAGGLSPGAYLFGAAFTRESERRLQQQRLDEYADQLEGELGQASVNAASGAVTDVDTAAAAAQQKSGQALIARLREVKATGRIVLESRPDSVGADSLPDLSLEDGDHFIVPKLPSSVNVEGAVYDANAFLYDPHRRVGDYLRLAGGGIREADKARSFVLRADGSVVSSQFHSALRSGFDNVRVYPGDTIVVPQNLNHRSNIRNLLDFSQIISAFGLGAAAIALLS